MPRGGIRAENVSSRAAVSDAEDFNEIKSWVYNCEASVQKNKHGMRLHGAVVGIIGEFIDTTLRFIDSNRISRE